MAKALWWNDLEIFSRSLGSLPYRDYRIEIFESKRSLQTDDQNKRLRFFYTPIVLLRPTSAKCYEDAFEGVNVVSFQVEMWNEEIQQQVANFVSHELKHQVDRSQVSVIPFSELRLVSKLKGVVAKSDWLKYQSHQSTFFELTCSTNNVTEDQVVELLRKSSRQLQNKFEIEFALSARTSKSNETTISIENVMKGELFSKLNQQFSNKEYALLTAEDKQSLLSESANNIIVETYSDTNEASSANTRENIQRTLEKLWQFSSETVNKDSMSRWESVFWNEENTRPDRIAKTLNEFIQKTDNETKNSLISRVKNNSATSLDVHVDLKLLKLIKFGQLDGKWNSDSSSSNSRNDEQLFKLKTEDVSSIEFDGEKFVPKSMNLYRLNLNAIKNEQHYRDKSVNVCGSESVLTLSVNIPSDEGDDTSRLNQCPNSEELDLAKWMRCLERYYGVRK